MTNSRNNYSYVAALLLVAFGALFFYFLKPFEKDQETGSKHAPLQPHLPVNQGGGNLDSATSQHAGVNDRNEYLCTIMKHLCIDDPLTAATATEARWLQQFGYPSQKRLDELEHMSLSQLESLSATGDLPARIVMGKKQIDLGDHIKGRAAITDALINGSTYAAYELARSNNAETPSSTRTDAVAYYRLAYLFGDWKASRELYRTQEADSLEMRMADERAMQLYRNVLNERGKRRVGMRVWPRP